MSITKSRGQLASRVYCPALLLRGIHASAHWYTATCYNLPIIAGRVIVHDVDVRDVPLVIAEFDAGRPDSIV